MGAEESRMCAGTAGPPEGAEEKNMEPAQRPLTPRSARARAEQLEEEARRLTAMLAHRDGQIMRLEARLAESEDAAAAPQPAEVAAAGLSAKLLELSRQLSSTTAERDALLAAAEEAETAGASGAAEAEARARRAEDAVGRLEAQLRETRRLAEAERSRQRSETEELQRRLDEATTGAGQAERGHAAELTAHAELERRLQQQLDLAMKDAGDAKERAAEAEEAAAVARAAHKEETDALRAEKKAAAAAAASRQAELETELAVYRSREAGARRAEEIVRASGGASGGGGSAAPAAGAGSAAAPAAEAGGLADRLRQLEQQLESDGAPPSSGLSHHSKARPRPPRSRGGTATRGSFAAYGSGREPEREPEEKDEEAAAAEPAPAPQRQPNPFQAALTAKVRERRASLRAVHNFQD